MNTTHLDQFTRAYVKCALWSCLAEDTSGADQPLDQNYSASDISEETGAQMIADCAKFREMLMASLPSAGLTDARSGHDFWLDRNGHGSGFWDEDFTTEEQHTCLLRCSEVSKTFGSFDLYIGGDGQVHGSPLTAVTPVKGGAK